MSLTETTLDDFHQPQTEPEPEIEVEPEPGLDAESEDDDGPRLTVPDWATNTNWDSNHQCARCCASVDPHYHRFHRDEDDVLRRCPHCPDVTQTEMKKGAGAVDDYGRRSDGDSEQTPTDSLFGSADTSDLPSYMTGGGD